MSALIIDGKILAKQTLLDVAERAASVASKRGRPPKLAVVLVGDNPASHVYVRSKTKKALACGMEVEDVKLDTSATQQELEEKLEGLARAADIDGILLQLPLPDGFDESSALLRIPPKKDVDGLHPENQGYLWRGDRCHQPCTPKGCIMLIKHALASLGRDDSLSGLKAVVLGRSILVGKPVGALLLQENATVTFCHSRTKDLASEIGSADIVVAAVGRPRMVKAEWLSDRAIVIDVGINRLEDGSLVGDVDFDTAAERVSAITPVPGGVGPMTIAMLLSNTVDAADWNSN